MDYLMENSSVFFELILGGIFIIEGLMQIFTGKITNYSNMSKRYTAESIKSFIKPSGFPLVLEGAAIILAGFSMDGGPLPRSVMWGSFTVMAICVVIYLLMTKKYLVKK